ncbi:MAG: acyl-CoA thioesterase [Acidimicrobiia bacterium]
MALDHDARVAADAAFLGLDDKGGGRFRFEVSSPLARADERLYGGAAVALSVAAASSRTGRDAVWMTTQFVSTAMLGAPVELFVDVLAEGRRTSQVRVTATTDTGVVFASLGACGVIRTEAMTGTFEHRPLVTPPEQGEAGFASRSELDVGWHTATEVRTAEILDHPDEGPGRLCLWLRRRDRGPVTPAISAYLADLIPLSIARGCEVLGAGTSLDNTIRIGTAAETEWILLDMRPNLAIGGYGHGVANVWTEDGQLLAVASQTASMMALDIDPLTAFT